MKSVFTICVVAAALGCAAVLPAGAERTDGEFALRAESVLREEARGLHADLTSPHRWREWALDRANGEDADFRAWMSSRWQETPGRLADGYAASLADWAGSGLRESGWVETLDFSFQLPLQGRAGRLSVNAVGPLLPGLAGGDSVLGWQLPLALGALEEEDGDAEVVGNFGLFYRRALGDSGLAGLNIFGDYQDAGADGGFWRWSVGAEYRTAWADVFANRYIPSSEARRSVLSGGREERIAYTAGGYDAEVRFHAPSSRWLEGFAEYSLWEGEYGDADEEGFRYGLRLSPATGGLADGFHLEADYDDAADGGLGARFSYDWTLGQRPRSRGYAAFDPRGHFFTPVERRHDQKIRVRIRSLDRDGFGAFARSAVAGACARGAGVELDTDADSAVNASLIAEAEAGDYDGVCGALRNGASPNHPDFLDDLSDADEDWAMHYAAGLSSSSAVSILSALIGEGGDIDAPGEYEYTPLHSAIEAGAVEASRFLIISGANLRLSDDVGVRPLGAAGDALVVAEDSGLSVMAANVRRIITLLLAHSAECRRRFATRYGPEVRAVCAGKGYATPLLWEAGGAAYAASGHEGRVTLLREAFSGAGPEDFSPMYSAVAGGVFMVRGRDLEAGESLSPGVYSVTALVSAEQGRLEAATLYATLAVSVLSGGGAFTITASPYAKYPNGGGLATFAVSAAGLPSGLSLLYGKAGGSEELTLTAEGYARWEGDSARATVFAGYEMEVLAGAPWLAGTLSFSLTVSAACAAGAEHGDNVNVSRSIGLAAYYQDLNTVCWRIGRDPDAVNSRVYGNTPLYQAILGLINDVPNISDVEMINLLLAYGANVNAKIGNDTPLDLAVNHAGGRVSVVVSRLREAGGVCENYNEVAHPECGLNFNPREFVKSVSHGWAESVLSVTVGVAPEAPVAFYELDHSRLTVRKWEDGEAQGFEVLPLAGAPLLGGEALTASVIVWAAQQTLVASLAVTVGYGGIEALSAADSVFTVAWNYQGDLFTVASGTGEVSLSYDSSAASAAAALVSLSPFSSAWRWNGGENAGGPHAASVLVTLSRAHYATRTETAQVSIYAAAQSAETILTASPYATGGLLTLSHPGLSGLVFEKVSGSEELTLGSGGVAGWKSGATVTAKTDHVLEADATMAGMLGTLRFSARISANCSSEAQYGANESDSGMTFQDALKSDDAAAVCWHIGHGQAADVVLVLDYGVDAQPLHLAAGSNATMAAGLLLALGADADARDSEGWRPLHWAAYEDGGGGAVALLLLAAGADGNARAGAERQAPLHWAAEYGKADVISALLSDADVLVNPKDESGWTPLHWAVDAGEEESARLLLSDGRAEANAADDSGLSALDLAVEKRAKDMAEILRAGGGVCLDNGHSGRIAHLCGLRFWPRSAEAVAKPVGYSGDIYTISVTTNTARRRAGDSAYFAVGESGFTVLADDNNGVVRAARSLTDEDNGRELRITVSRQNRQTLIMTVTLAVLRVPHSIPSTIYAADGYQGPVGDFQTLEGATVSYEGGLEGTPFVAISPPPDSISRVALSLTDPVYGPAILTATAALLVKKSGFFPSTVRATVFLNVLGPQPSAAVTISPYSSHAGESLPMLFAEMNFTLIGESGDLAADASGVLKAARDLEFPLSYGATVKATAPGFLGEMLLTVSALADCLSATGSQNDDSFGQMLYDSISKHASSYPCLLIRGGANVNYRKISESSRTPLHQAVKYGNAIVAGMLIRAGANVQAQTDPHLTTPLYRAVKAQKSAMVSLLLDAGADPNLSNSGGLTPLDVAVTQADDNSSGVLQDIIKLIRDADGVCMARQAPYECGGFGFYPPPPSMVVVRMGHIGVAVESAVNIPDDLMISHQIAVVSSEGGFTLSAPAEGVDGFGLSTDQRQTVAGAVHVVSVRIVSTKTGEGGGVLTLTTAISISVSDSAFLCAPNSLLNNGQTPAMLAASIISAADNGEPDRVCELIRRGAHFKTTHESQVLPPLHVVAVNRLGQPRAEETLEIAEMLLYNGAEPSPIIWVGSNPRTPVGQAKVWNDIALEELIRGYGGLQLFGIW